MFPSERIFLDHSSSSCIWECLFTKNLRKVRDSRFALGNTIAAVEMVTVVIYKCTIVCLLS